MRPLVVCEFGAPSATNFPSCDEVQVKEGFWTLCHRPAVVPCELGCACEWQRNASRGVNSDAWLLRMTARAHPAAVDKDVRGRVHHDIYLSILQMRCELPAYVCVQMMLDSTDPYRDTNLDNMFLDGCGSVEDDDEQPSLKDPLADAARDLRLWTSRPQLRSRSRVNLTCPTPAASPSVDGINLREAGSSNCSVGFPVECRLVSMPTEI
ncbi:hypothetical protein L1887_48285 [Cichorium endivia]|nr:hypothetical protein L1887_48285 [Cichorium endivia]